MAKVSDFELTASVAIVAAAISMFTAYCPGVSDVLEDNQSGGMRSKLDFGLPAASISAVSLGVVLSFFTGSFMPTVIGIGISGALWLAYELAFERSC